MHTFRNITMVSAVLAGALCATMAPAAELDVDCAVPMTNPISALVWSNDSETWVARVVDIGRVEIVQTAFKAPAPAAVAAAVRIDPAFDANRMLDESIIGAGSMGPAKTISFDPGS